MQMINFRDCERNPNRV